MQNSEVLTTVGKTPAKSIVRVHFPARNTTLAYFNDRFDLHIGDIVYVDGKLEGLRGFVVDVTHNFKIRVSDYKRVIGKADTTVSGTLHMAGSHFVSLSPDVIPFEKVLTWYRAPEKAEAVYVTGNDETAFSLDDLSGMNIGSEIAGRGNDYYLRNKVRYICVDGTRGHAIVEGTRAYEVEFICEDEQIRNLTCDCFCSYTCKHEYAAMLQLKETLKALRKIAPDGTNGYFSAISKAALFQFAVEGKGTGAATLCNP